MDEQTIILLIALVVVLIIIEAIWRKISDYERLKYEFITIIAHKFRTPLTQTKWIIEEALGRQQDAYNLESLKSLQKSNQNLIGLTSTLVDLTDVKHKNLASYNLERINICNLVKETLDSLKDRFHEKNIFLSLQCSVPEIFVKLDNPRMDFVLHTVLENSINYSKIGSNVEVVVTKKRRKVTINVVDYGIGIDKSEMPKVFTKFFRSKSAENMDTEGFGVGLYLAKSIVKRHHGKIEVFSDGLDEGSTFKITLPTVK